MAHHILVVTSTQGFGELIEQTLNETGLYQVVLVNNPSDALKKTKTRSFDVLILDEECNPGLVDLISGLRNMLPGIAVIVIPLTVEPCSEIAALGLQGTLSKPFYLPDLLEIVHKSVKNKTAQKEVVRVVDVSKLPASSSKARLPEVSSLDWLQDAARAAQHLTSLSLESSALAALIVRDRKLWSYAGQLPQPASQELTMIIANYWSQGIALPPGSKVDGKSDMARFIRLESTGGEYMLYATELAGGMVLALVFDAETPFGKIRAQASRLARALTLPPEADRPVPDAGPKVEETQPAPPTSVPDAASAAPTTPSAAISVPTESVQPGGSEETEEEDIPLNLPPLWDDVPPPDPARLAKDKTPASQPVPPAPAVPDQPPSVDMLTSESKPEVQPESKTEPALADSRSQIPAAVESPQFAGLQPISPAVYQLTYACLIIPRMTRHHVTGDLAEKLATWMGELCMAFDWRLEHMIIQPDYFHWIVNVPPATSPGYLIRVIRQQTSKRIFTSFPELARENPSGDFWAPGYLVMSSAQPPPEQIIQDFIHQIRQHQGASQPSSLYSRGR